MTQEIAVSAKAVAPWIGVGKSGNWTSVEDAMNECGLGFEVSKEDMKFSYSDNGIEMYEIVPGFKATVRTDEHKPLGCVSSTYQIVQNQEIFSMLDPFIDAGGVITSAGMTDEGLCFMVATMNQAMIAGDEYMINVMATNSFNGRFPAALICSPVRIICQNMYRQLMNRHDNVARFRHSLNIGERLEAVRTAYRMFNQYQQGFSESIEKLKQLPAAHSIEEFVELMYPYSSIDESSSRFESSRERVDERRLEYINKYYSSPTNSDHGSCFALVNAYYDYTSHNVPVRSTEDTYRSKRLSSIVGGTMVKPNLMSFMCEHK